MFYPSKNLVSEPRLIEAPGRLLIGLSQTMTVAHFPVAELWKRFMPRTGELKGRKSGDLISAAVYPENYFISFDAEKSFVKWAAAEVEESFEVPEGMESLEIPAGLYLVFHYKGLSSDRSVYQYIFGHCLPQFGYRPDHRPQFEVLGEAYRNNDPESEEEIWIPVQRE